MNGNGTLSLPTAIAIDKTNGFQWNRFGSALLFALIATFGVPMNMGVCYVTLKYRKVYKTLGSKTSWLIALNSLFEVLHQLAHFTHCATTAIGLNFWPARTALLAHSYAILGFQFVISSFPLMSADRLLAVAAPIFYSNLKRRPYIAVHLLLIVLLSAYPIYNIVEAVSKSPDALVSTFLAFPLELPRPEGPHKFVIPVNLALQLLAILLYVLIGIFVGYTRRSVTPNDELMRRLYRSLFLIVAINVGGYLAISWLSLLAPIFGSQFFFAVIHGMPFLSYFVDLAAASNGPILILNSQEYRQAYKLEFQRVLKAIKKFWCPHKVNPHVTSMAQLSPVSRQIPIVG